MVQLNQTILDWNDNQDTDWQWYGCADAHCRINHDGEVAHVVMFLDGNEVGEILCADLEANSADFYEERLLIEYFETHVAKKVAA